MATIADLVIKVLADTDTAERDMKSFGSKVKGGFGKALIPAAAVLGGVAIAAKKTTDAATNLGEAQNATNVVFGKAGKTVHDFAKVADKEAGLSMRQLHQLVTPIGAMLINTGDSADVAATKSVNLAKRAADMASVFNVDVSEALGAIQAGLRGEADPLERFGVGLSDAAVKAKAMAMGLAESEKQVDASDKAQARYALILDQTNKLQGDFKNTSDSAANASRINAAAQENLQAKIGTGLLPVVQTYQSLLGTVTGFMAEHTGAVKVAAGVLIALAGTVIAVNAATAAWTAAQGVAKAATVAWTGVQWLLNAALNANPIGLVVIALVALGVAIAVAWNKSETFRNIVTGAWNAVRDTTETVFNFVRNKIDNVMDVIKGIASKTPLGLLITHFGEVKDVAETVFGAIRVTVGTAVALVWKLIGALGALADKLSNVGSLGGKHGFFDPRRGIPGFASGVRDFAGGLAVVGEEGPELVSLPRGADVYPTGTGPAGGPMVNIEGDLVIREELDFERAAAMFGRRLAVTGA